MLQGFFDMHCHIIPDVDDGAATPEGALALLQEEYSQGVRHIILTPHYRRGMFETDRGYVEHQFEKLSELASPVFPDMSLHLGCEFHANMEMTDLLRRDHRYRMAGSFYVLTEFSSAHTESYITERLHTLLAHGYTPIVAHAERYEPMFAEYDYIDTLRQAGVRIQINADTLTGRDGRAGKKFGKKLIAYDMLDFVGSDTHDLSGRACHMKECAAYLAKRGGEDYAKKILIRNPSDLIRGQR